MPGHLADRGYPESGQRFHVLDQPFQRLGPGQAGLDGARNTSHGERDHDLATHRAFLEMQQAGGDFREEIEQRVGTDRHDRGYPQAKDQNREQQNAAPHSGHSDEDTDDKANQNFGR